MTDLRFETLGSEARGSVAFVGIVRVGATTLIRKLRCSFAAAGVEP